MSKLWRLPIIITVLLCMMAPAQAQPAGSSTQTASGIGCNKAIVYDASTNGSTQLVAPGANGEVIYVCGYTIWSGGTASVELDYGTGTACATGTKKIVPAYNLVANTGVTDSSPYFRGIAAASGAALCIKTSAGVAVQAVVYYAQF